MKFITLPVILLLTFTGISAQKIQFDINGNEVGHIDETRLSLGDPGANILIGSLAGSPGLTGSGNTALGVAAARTLGTGSFNTVIGRSAGFNFTNGQSNVVVGAFAGYNISTGADNVFLGRSSGFLNSSGIGNVAIGRRGLSSNLIGNENVAVGDSALYFAHGNSNVAIGAHAGTNNNTGSGNIFLGSRAGSNELGSDRLYIQNDAQAFPLIYGEFDTQVLGFNADVGIGIQNPVDRLHINNSMRLDGGNPVMRFYDGATQRAFLQHNAATFFITNSANGPIHLSTNGNIRTTIDQFGRMGIGTTLPSDKLHVSGGLLRIENATPQLSLFQGSTQAGILQVSGTTMNLANNLAGSLAFKTSGVTRMTVSSAGNVGIGLTVPQDRLHVIGDLRLEASDPSMKFYTSGFLQSYLEHRSNGHLYLMNTHISGKLYLGTDDQARMTIAHDGEIGIGVTSPNYTLEIDSDLARGVDILNDYTGTLSKYGVYSAADFRGTGSRTGIYGSATGSSGGDITRGVHGLANGNGGPSTLYGVSGIVTLSGTGTKYALHGSAPTAGDSWALWADGHAHFEGDVRIGHTSPVTGYVLSVDGKIMSEEIKVQMSGSWPDYVFKEDYSLRPMSEVQSYIAQHGHLPGVPSAEKVSQDQGVELGEMNRILLEKVEELTLYVIDLQHQIDALQKSPTTQNQNQ